MKVRVIVSLLMTIGLAALSIAAFLSTGNITSTNTTVKQNIKSKVVIANITEKFVVLATERVAFVETFSIDELTSVPYQSQAGIEEKSQDDYLLAKIAMAEAEGEDIEGKALVMLVVLNRVQSNEFPNTIEAVICQPKQFSPITDGRFDKVEPNDDCWKALTMIKRKNWDESMGATYFESKSKSTWHSENLKFLFQHGNHYFYKEYEKRMDEDV